MFCSIKLKKKNLIGSGRMSSSAAVWRIDNLRNYHQHPKKTRVVEPFYYSEPIGTDIDDGERAAANPFDPISNLNRKKKIPRPGSVCFVCVSEMRRITRSEINGKEVEKRGARNQSIH